MRFILNSSVFNSLVPNAKASTWCTIGTPLQYNQQFGSLNATQCTIGALLIVVLYNCTTSQLFVKSNQG